MIYLNHITIRYEYLAFDVYTKSDVGEYQKLLSITANVTTIKNKRKVFRLCVLNPNQIRTNKLRLALEMY